MQTQRRVHRIGHRLRWCLCGMVSFLWCLPVGALQRNHSAKVATPRWTKDSRYLYFKTFVWKGGSVKANTKNPTSVVALTLWGETRGEDHEGKLAAASVIWREAVRNSATVAGRNEALVDECLKRKRYSCWQRKEFVQSIPKDSDPIWRECVKIAMDMTMGQFKPILEASHYFNPDLVPGRWPSSWDRSKMVFVKRVGNHDYYMEKNRA